VFQSPNSKFPVAACSSVFGISSLFRSVWLKGSLSLSHFVFIESGAGFIMSRSSGRLPWWDREFDQRGETIRADVREAAQRVWPLCAALARSRVQNAEYEAQELLERVVVEVSRSLNKENSPAQPRDVFDRLLKLR